MTANLCHGKWLKMVSLCGIACHCVSLCIATANLRHRVRLKAAARFRLEGKAVTCEVWTNLSSVRNYTSGMGYVCGRSD